MSEISNNFDTTSKVTIDGITVEDLIKGQEKLSIEESRLFAIAVSKVVSENNDLQTYTTSIPELAVLMGIDETNLYRDIKGICTALMHSIINIRKQNEKGRKSWYVFRLVNSVVYNDSFLTIKLSDDIKPFVFELYENYSQPLLGNLLTFRSYHTMRLYQRLILGYKQQGKGEWAFSCEELRELFQTRIRDEEGNVIREQYRLNRDLLRNTIIPALSELHKSDFAFVYNYEEVLERKEGSKGKPALAGIRFKIMFFEDKNCKNTVLDYIPIIGKNSQQTIIPFGEEKPAEK